MSNIHCRERRSWTAKEDELLRAAVQREDPNNPNPSKWHAIAKHVPNRTNKDCRKRWFAKMASDVVKGGWSPDEDEKLVKGIERFGTRWSLVASIVQSRNSDQCAKRWTDTLNPAIDRTTWTPEADELLLQAVQEHGKVWTKIVKTYFPGRTGLSAKNRYNSITRFTAENSRSRSRRKSPEGPYHNAHKTESVSSSSSSSASPSTPSLPLPQGIQSPYPLQMDSHLSHALRSAWVDELDFGAGLLSIPSTPSTDASEHFAFDSLAMDQLSASFSSSAEYASMPMISEHQVYQGTQQEFTASASAYSQFTGVYGPSSSSAGEMYGTGSPFEVGVGVGVGIPVEMMAAWEGQQSPVPVPLQQKYNTYKHMQPDYAYSF